MPRLSLPAVVALLALPVTGWAATGHPSDMDPACKAVLAKAVRKAPASALAWRCRAEDEYSRAAEADRLARKADDILLRCETAGKMESVKCSRAAGEKARNEAAATALREAAVAHFMKVADAYATSPEVDRALMGAGYAADDLGRRDEARAIFKRLIKDYPASRHVPDVYVYLGDYYFGEGEMTSALKLYEKAMTYPDSKAHAYATYKAAWSWFNLADFRRALELLSTVVRHPVADDALIRAARKDLVRTYAEVGSPAKAAGFFKKIGGSGDWDEMLERLGDTYFDLGKFEDAISVRRALLVEISAFDPVRAHRVQVGIIHATLAVGDRARILAAIKRLAAITERVRSITEDSECDRLTEEIVRELATVWRIEAHRPDSWDSAGAAHALYLDTFPEHPKSIAMRVGYGEVLMRLGKLAEAIDQFEMVIARAPEHPAAADARRLATKARTRLEE